MLLALLLLRVLDVLKPWRLTGGIDTRDTWRVCALSTFFPWTPLRWRAKVPFFAERYLNRELKAALEARAQRPPIIVTTGFRSIVAPLLAAMGFADALLIAAACTRSPTAVTASCRWRCESSAPNCGLLHGRHRFDQRSECCRAVLGRCEPSAPGALSPALSGVYLPGEYISQIKHPGSAISSAAYSRRISPSGAELNRPGDQSRHPPRRIAAAVAVVLGDLRARLCR